MMRELKVFFRQNCPRCPAARSLAEDVENSGGQVSYFDVETIDGLAEAALYTVQSTPSLVVCDKNESEIASWRGDVPPVEEIRRVLMGVPQDQRPNPTADAAG